MVVIIPLMCNGHAIITSVFIPETILDQTRQNGYQTNSFGVYIHNPMFVFILEQVFSEVEQC